MASPDSNRDGDLADINERLDEGLRSCRVLVSEYRHLIGSASPMNPPALREAANDALRDGNDTVR